MRRRIPLSHLLLIVPLLLSSCSSVQPEQKALQETFDILSIGRRTRAARRHSESQSSINVLNAVSVSQSLSIDVNMKTIETVDFRGKPFVNITFSLRLSPLTMLWDFAATLTGNEWSY